MLSFNRHLFMINKNIKYKNENIFNFYKNNRNKWEQLYLSEKKILRATFLKNSNILDLGCGCGGLGSILKKKFKINNYYGIDINYRCIQYAKKKYPKFKFYNKNFENFDFKKKFDYVISFSCIDWDNGKFYKLFNKAVLNLKNNGGFIITLRFTDKQSIISKKKSYQYIFPTKKNIRDKTNYVVLNKNEFINKIRKKYNITSINGYGYKLPPPKTANTPYKKLFYAALLIRFNKKKNKQKTNINIKLLKKPI